MRRQGLDDRQPNRRDGRRIWQRNRKQALGPLSRQDQIELIVAALIGVSAPF